MTFLSRRLTLVSFAAVMVAGLIAIPAEAQRQGPSNRNQPTHSTPNGEGSSTINPNCITHVCKPKKPMRKVSSKESCECGINVIRSGGRTIQVKDCYVQLPDNTVHFCKNPFAKGQAG
jgi:hypothetical protein